MQSRSANAGKIVGARRRRVLRTVDHFANREWHWIVVLAWLIISACYLQTYSSAIHWLSLSDTDDNMRYLQVRDWLNGQSWWDLTQHRMDPPRGANIHWSRLVDLPIAALMLLFRLFMTTGQADRLAVGVAPLLPLLPIMMGSAFITRRIALGNGWFVAMLLPLGANMGLGMVMPLRIDHHGWQLACTVMTLAGLVDRKWVRGGILAGVSSAASVVIGMEMMVYLAGAGGIIALRWIFKDGAARRLQPYALSLAAATAVGYAAFASNANRAPTCDALTPAWTSILMLAAGVLFAISLLPLRGAGQRLLAAALGGAVILLFAWLSFPQCLTGVYQLSPELQTSWLAYIREAKPITAQARSAWVPMVAMPIAGLICAFAGCWRVRRDVERLWAWGTVALMIAFALALAFYQIRSMPAAQFLSVAPIGWAIWTLIVRLVRGRAAVRAGAFVGLLGLGSAVDAYGLYPVVNGMLAPVQKKAATPAAQPAASPAPAPGKAGKAAPTAAPVNAAKATKPGATANARCRTLPALQPLDQLPPALIFTLVDLGPRIIAVTHHSVIAGPYHRNGAAILDIHHAFDGSPERFRQIAAAHGAQYLLSCPGFPEGTIYQQRSVHGFYARLMRGEKFDFLEPVTLRFDGVLPYQLYRIVPPGKSAPSVPLAREEVPQQH